MAESGSLVIGRAIVTSDNSNFATWGQRVAQKTQTGDVIEQDNYYFWLPTFSDKRYVGDSLKGENINLCLMLETVWVLKRKQTSCCPIAVLYFHVPLDAALAMISSRVTTEDFVSKKVTLKWLSLQDMMGLDDILLQGTKLHCHKWSTVKKLVHQVWRRVMSVQVPPVSSCDRNMFHVEEWKFAGMLINWLYQNNIIGLYEEQANKQLDGSSQFRSLRLGELVYLFLHIHLRWKSGKYPNSSIVIAALLGIAVVRDSTVEDMTMGAQDEELFNRSLQLEDHHRSALSRVGMATQLIEQTLKSFVRLLQRYEHNSRMVRERICVPLERARQKTSVFQLYVAEQINKVMQDNTYQVPHCLFDVSAVDKWSHNRQVEIDAIFKPANFYGNVYRKVKPIVSEGVVLRLYGNLRPLLTHMDSDHRDILYRAINVGRLSDEFIPYPRLIGDIRTSPPPYHLPHLVPGETNTAGRLREARAYMTPIWFQRDSESNAPVYYVTEILQVGVDSSPPNAVSLPTDMATLLQQIYPRDGGYQSEYVNNQMHVSTIIADCDINLRSNAEAPSVESLSKAMIEIADELFAKIPQVRGRVKHYLFLSKQEKTQPTTKIGIHHHMQLPPGVVFTTVAVAQFLRILETIRFTRSESIGMRTANNQPIYDAAIYGSEVETNVRPRGHGLRGPWQMKPRGERQLQPIFSGDVPTEALFTHGAQIVNGKHTVVGVVVEKLVGDLRIDDREFNTRYKDEVMHKFMDSEKCGTNLEGIMEHLNRRTVFFQSILPQQEHVKEEVSRSKEELLVLQTIQSLWEQRGVRQLQTYMKQAVGKDGLGYESHILSSVIPQTSITLLGGTPTLTSSLLPQSQRYGMLPFCPHTPHRNKPTTTRTTMLFSEGMNSLGIQVNCFKCTKRLHSKVFMDFDDDFIAKPIREIFTREFLPKFEVWDRVDVIEPYVDDTELRYIPQSEKLRAPYDDVLPGLTTDIRYLYAFLPYMSGGPFAGFRSATGHFVAMHVSSDTRKRNVIVQTKSSSKWLKFLETNELSPLIGLNVITQSVRMILCAKDGISE